MAKNTRRGARHTLISFQCIVLVKVAKRAIRVTIRILHVVVIFALETHLLTIYTIRGAESTSVWALVTLTSDSVCYRTLWASGNALLHLCTKVKAIKAVLTTSQCFIDTFRTTLDAFEALISGCSFHLHAPPSAFDVASR